MPLLRRLATGLAALLVAITAIASLWSLRVPVSELSGLLTVLVSLGLLGLVVILGIGRSISTATPYW